MKTLPTLSKEWRVSFEIKPKNYDYKSYAQILQLTTGGKYGNIGDRIPALWIHRTRGIYISTYLNGNPAVGKAFPSKKPVLNKWTSIEIEQAKMGSNYVFSLKVGGETLWSVKNTDPREFSMVQVFASSDWYVAQEGSIRRFQIENKTPGKANKGPKQWFWTDIISETQI